MQTYKLGGLASMSEFVQNGDCGEDAYLMAVHAMAPGRFPLTWGGLLAVDHDEETHGYAAANGAQTIYQMSDYLTRVGVPHKVYGWDATSNTGGVPFSLDALHVQLKAFAAPILDPNAPTPPPVIAETSTAGAGFPQDESAVLYHFATFGGISIPESTAETGGYWRVDGDAVATNAQSGAPSPAILTQWAQIVAAGIIAYITIEGLPPASVAGEVTPMAWTQQSDGTGRDDQGHVCGQGVMAYIAAHGMAGVDGLMGETYYAPNASFTPLADGRIVSYDTTYGTGENGAAVAVNLYDELQAAKAAATQPTPGDDEKAELSPANVASFRSTLSAQAQTAKQLADDLAAAAASLPTGV